ncbi:MAG: SCO family protein [Bacteroidetes bacterium]|nr:SCO family protein [Bacteroidota bacterium]
MRKYFLWLVPFWFLWSSFNFPNEKKHLAQKVADIPMFNSKGEVLQFSSIFNGKPIIISPVYTRCYSICGIVSSGVQNVIKDMDGLGDDYTVVSFSFDSTENPRSLAVYESRWIIDGKKWMALSATPQNIRKFMSSIGVEYDYIPSTKEYDHPPLLVVLTPEGTVSRYIYGVTPSKKDLKISVMEAQAKITRPGLFTGFYLRCLKYDPLNKTYKVDWRFIISTSAGLLIILLVSRLFIKSFIID